ncbi:MAG TPA: hypothetical protein VL463_03580 [Kofleriaceae bacterium]|nr:hypothetical protein [Kofleriaceae bacterium]
MSTALTGIKSMGDALEDDPALSPVRTAVELAAALIPRLVRDDDDHLAAELITSLAIMEECAASATLEQGRVRRKLIEIARGKCARARCSLEIAVAWEVVTEADIAEAKAALDAADAVLAPPPRVTLSALLRR